MLKSPKSQYQLVGVFVELSVKNTVNGTVPLVGLPENAATGAGGFAVMYAVLFSQSDPAELLAFSDTVYVPAAV